MEPSLEDRTGGIGQIPKTLPRTYWIPLEPNERMARSMDIPFMMGSSQGAYQ